MQHQIDSCTQKWINLSDWVPDERILKQILKYKPTGRRDRGRPWKRWNE